METDGATANAPATLGTNTPGKVCQQGGTTLYFTAETMENATLTVSGLGNGDTVTMGGQTYTPTNGTVTISVSATGDQSFSVTVAGTGELIYTMTLQANG